MRFLAVKSDNLEAEMIVRVRDSLVLYPMGSTNLDVKKLECLVALCRALLAHVYVMWISVSRKAAWRPNLVNSLSHRVGGGGTQKLKSSEKPKTSRNFFVVLPRTDRQTTGRATSQHL